MTRLANRDCAWSLEPERRVQGRSCENLMTTSRLSVHQSPQRPRPFSDFIGASSRTVTVRYEGGIGSTGTLMAAGLIRPELKAEDAIAAAGKAEPAADESRAQFRIC